VLLAVSEEAKTCLPFLFFRSMYNISIIRFGFCDIQNIQVKIVSLSLWLGLIAPTPTLITLDCTKTSSNNHLTSHALYQNNHKFPGL